MEDTPPRQLPIPMQVACGPGQAGHAACDATWQDRAAHLLGLPPTQGPLGIQLDACVRHDAQQSLLASRRRCVLGRTPWHQHGLGEWWELNSAENQPEAGSPLPLPTAGCSLHSHLPLLTAGCSLHSHPLPCIPAAITGGARATPGLWEENQRQKAPRVPTLPRLSSWRRFDEHHSAPLSALPLPTAAFVPLTCRPPPEPSSSPRLFHLSSLTAGVSRLFL